MDNFIKELCKYYGMSFEETLRKFNNNEHINDYMLDNIIWYKNNINNIIYKEDMPILYSRCRFHSGYIISHEEFMEEVMSNIKYYKLDINNLTFENCEPSYALSFYFLETFLEHRPIDIKIALKD